MYLTNTPVISPLRQGRPLKLYISASESTNGSMLAQEDEEGNERAIDYLS